MLKVAFEYPFSLHSILSQYTTLDFFIAPFVPKEFIRKPSEKYCILDNGTYELREDCKTTLPELLNIASIINADEIVLPEVWASSVKTTRLVSELSKQVYSLKKMAVVQGNSVDELLVCGRDLSRLDIDCIGLGAYYPFMENLTSLERSEIRYQLILDLNSLGVPLHVLGIHSFTELKACRKANNVRSLDTSFPVLFGVHGISLRQLDWSKIDYRKPKRPENFFNIKSVTFETLNLIIDNIKYFFEKLCV